MQKTGEKVFCSLVCTFVSLTEANCVWSIVLGYWRLRLSRTSHRRVLVCTRRKRCNRDGYPQNLGR